MNKIILSALITVFGLYAFSAGNPEYTVKCVVIPIKKEDLKVTNSGRCNFLLKQNGQKDKLVSLSSCPEPTKEKFIYAWSNFDLFTDDYLEITSDKNCDPMLFKNLISNSTTRTKNQTLILLNKNLKPNDLMSKISNLNFFRIRTQDKVWTYHYTPGVSVDIEVTGEQCNGRLCLDENKQKFSKVIKSYIDFIWMSEKGEIYYSSAVNKK